MLRTRGKAHKIISHAVAEDPDIEWSTISKKLISNYGATKGNMDANIKITQLEMKEEETVGEYLARSRTLIKTKLKDRNQWLMDYNDTDAFHVCNRINKARLRSCMLPRVQKYSSYKEFFDSIEEEWDRGYIMEDDFIEKPKQEFNELQYWEEQTPEDQQEMMIQAEICQIFQKYGRQPPPYGQYRGQRPTDSRQYSGKPYRGGGYRSSAPRMSVP